MKTKLKKLVLFLSIVLLLLIAFAMWYTYTYSMDEVEGFTVNTIEMPHKIAVVTQGSVFKDAVVTNIVNHYKLDSVYIDVLDVSKISELSVLDYQVIIILHTWEYGKPPISVTKFVDNNISRKSKIVTLSTSGEGTNSISNIDAIAGESIIENASDYSDSIITKIESLLHRENE